MSGDIQSVPYDLLAQFATQRIDFDEFDAWHENPALMEQNLPYENANIGSSFEGQYVNGQITGTRANAPLTLLENDNRELTTPGVTLEAGIYSSSSGTFAVSPAYRPAFRRMSLLGLSVEGNNAITRYNSRYTRRISGSFNQVQVIGIEPISVLYRKDQQAIGFRVLRLNRTSQIRSVVAGSGQPRFRVKFFRRDGSLISEVILAPDRDKYVAFARCGGAADIAGIQITNSTKSGLAFDDFIFGMPHTAPNPSPDENPLSQLAEEPSLDNPLNVDLCSFYTS